VITFKGFQCTVNDDSKDPTFVTVVDGVRFLEVLYFNTWLIVFHNSVL